MTKMIRITKLINLYSPEGDSEPAPEADIEEMVSEMDEYLEEQDDGSFVLSDAWRTEILDKVKGSMDISWADKVKKHSVSIRITNMADYMMAIMIINNASLLNVEDVAESFRRLYNIYSNISDKLAPESDALIVHLTEAKLRLEEENYNTKEEEARPIEEDIIKSDRTLKEISPSTIVDKIGTLVDLRTERSLLDSKIKIEESESKKDKMKKERKKIKRRISRRQKTFKRLADRRTKALNNRLEAGILLNAIKMKGSRNKPLSWCECYDYEVPEGEFCVPTFFRTQIKKLGQTRTLDIIIALENMGSTPGYKTLTRILNNNDVSLDVYMCTQHLIQKQEKLRFHYKICPHDDHMYVIKKLKTEAKGKENLEPDVFALKFEAAKKTTKLHEYTSYSFTHNGVKYIKDSKFKGIEDVLQFQGHYSEINEDLFRHGGISPFRYNDPKRSCAIKFDTDKSYSNIVQDETNSFMINTGLEEVKKFSGAAIRDYNFYKIDPPKDKKIILLIEMLYGVGVFWLAGHELNILNKLIKLLNLEKAKILYYVPAKRVREGKKLPDFTHDQIRNYTGFLASTMSSSEKRYSVSDPVESEALMKIFPEGETFYGDKEIIHTKGNYKKKSGCCAYLNIISIARSQMLEILIHVIKTCKVTIPLEKFVVRVMTDSIGFSEMIPLSIFKEVREDHYAIPGDDSFTFKIEQGEDKKTYGTPHNSFDAERYISKPSKLTTIYENGKEKKDIIKKLAGRSMLINDFAGAGKSYWVRKRMLEYLDDEDIPYICTSSINLNAREWNMLGRSMGHYTKRSRGFRSVFDEVRLFEYMIIDEASQLTMRSLHILERLKATCKIHIILIGDDNQCPSSDGPSYLKTLMVRRLCDFNEVRIGYHKDIRYTKEYYDFLGEIIKKGRRHYRFAINYAKKKIKKATIDELKSNAAISYTHTIRKKHDELEGADYSCRTIHSTQGLTIPKKYTVYLKSISSYRILYTALSRTKGFDLIRWT